MRQLGFTPLAIAPATGPAAPVVAAASFAPMAFEAVSDLWTKDPCKVAYDAYRQEFYDKSARLVDQWDAWKAANQLDYSRGAWVVNSMIALLNDFREYSEQAKTGCDAAWINERYHDYFDFFVDIVNGYKSALVAMDPRRMESGGIMQNAYTAIARLVDPVSSQSYFPQGGSLPPVNTYPTPFEEPLPASGGIPSGLLYGGLALAAGLFLFGGSR